MPHAETPTAELNLSSTSPNLFQKDDRKQMVTHDLSLPSNCQVEVNSNLESASDQLPTVTATRSPVPHLQHGDLLPPPTPKNTPADASPGLDGASYEEEVYRQASQSQALAQAPQDFAEKHTSMIEEKEKEDVEFIAPRESEQENGTNVHSDELNSDDDVRHLSHAVFALDENMEANPGKGSDFQDENAAELLEQLITNQTEMYAGYSSPQEKASCNDCAPNREVVETVADDLDQRENELSGDVDGRHLFNAFIADQPRTVVNGEATCAYSEAPSATDLEVSLADITTQSHGEDTTSPDSLPAKVHEEQKIVKCDEKKVKCDVESLLIAEPAEMLCHNNLQTGLFFSDVPEIRLMPMFKTEKTDGLQTMLTNTTGAFSNQPDVPAVGMFEVNILPSDEEQREESDSAENKRLKRSYGETPKEYPRSVLERKPEVEIKKNLFGETSSPLNGDQSVNLSQSQEHPLVIGEEPSMDPTEPHKSPKTEHYDAHGRKAYIEVSNVDQGLPEADVNECLMEARRGSTDDATFRKEIPLADIRFTIAEERKDLVADTVTAVSNVGVDDICDASADEDTHHHSDEGKPTKNEELPANDVLSDSNSTVRQRIRNKESDALPSELTKATVDAIESESIMLRFATYGMVLLAVFMLSALLFPSRMEQILNALMGRPVVGTNGANV